MVPVVRTITLVLIAACTRLHAVELTVLTDSTIAALGREFQTGTYLVPKTAAGLDAYLAYPDKFHLTRSHILETALNNATDSAGCLALLDTCRTTVMSIAQKTDRLLLVVEKMPAWLSSSSDGSPAQTPGWYVLNTKPPRSWIAWQNVVAAMVRKVSIEWGISAEYEIWNDPDLGSWTAGETDYFELYRRTYTAIRLTVPTAKIGGPAVNFWANHFTWRPPQGYIPDAVADSSLLGRLLDTARAAGQLPDFVSWHNFSINFQEYRQAAGYLNRKFARLGAPLPEIMVSEWNCPSAIRDLPLATAAMVVHKIKLTEQGLTANCVAAWQDFAVGAEEFHHDYGLVSYNGVAKPALYSLQLTARVQGGRCAVVADTSAFILAALQTDTLRLLVANYSPPPIAEALNYITYDAHFSLKQLDSAGYITLSGSSVTVLENILKQTTTIPGSDTLQRAINSAIPLYQHYTRNARYNRSFTVSIPALRNDIVQGRTFLIDSTANNNIRRYIVLRDSGLTRDAAVTSILASQQLRSAPFTCDHGLCILRLQPNAVVLVELPLPLRQVTTRQHPAAPAAFTIIPNPARDFLVVQNLKRATGITLYSADNTAASFALHPGKNVLPLNHLREGLYIACITGSHVSDSVYKILVVK
jgi:hypothetical protein